MINIAFFRAQEVMALRSDKHPCVTLALIASMPRVFESVQDKCISKANCKKDSKSFYVSDFSIILVYRFCSYKLVTTISLELEFH